MYIKTIITEKLNGKYSYTIIVFEKKDDSFAINTIHPGFQTEWDTEEDLKKHIDKIKEIYGFKDLKDSLEQSKIYEFYEQYRNPDPCCTYPFEPSPCGYCWLYASFVDKGIPESVKSSCEKCELYKAEKDIDK